MDRLKSQIMKIETEISILKRQVFDNRQNHHGAALALQIQKMEAEIRWLHDEVARLRYEVQP